MGARQLADSPNPEGVKFLVGPRSGTLEILEVGFEVVESALEPTEANNLDRLDLVVVWPTEASNLDRLDLVVVVAVDPAE